MVSRKRATALLISSVLVLGTCVGGATYAFFNDSAHNAENSFTTGTLRIDQERDMGDTVPGPLFYSANSDTKVDINNNIIAKYAYDRAKRINNPYGGEAIGGWAPGDSATRTLTIYSRGSLEAKLSGFSASIKRSFVINNLTHTTITGVTETSIGSDLDAYNEFIDKMNVSIDTPRGTNLYSGKLSSLLTGKVTLDPNKMYSLGDNGSNTQIDFTISLSTEANNFIKGKNIIVDFTVYAEQVKNNDLD